MRSHGRVDANSSEITHALEAIGCSVLDLSMLGGGVPDKLVGTAGLNLLIEDKDGKKSPSRRRLTDFQRNFHALWRGQIEVVKSWEEAVEFVQKHRLKAAR